MTLNKILTTGTLVAKLDSKAHPGQLARIYAVPESRGFQTQYQNKMFFWFIPYGANGLPWSFLGITKNTKRKNIYEFSNVDVIDQELWDNFLA